MCRRCPRNNNNTQTCAHKLNFCDLESIAIRIHETHFGPMEFDIERIVLFFTIKLGKLFVSVPFWIFDVVVVVVAIFHFWYGEHHLKVCAHT